MMAERAKTGNVFLDAWMDAFKPIIDASTTDAGDSTVSTGSHAPGSPASVERMFLGDWTGATAQSLFAWPGAGTNLADVWSDVAQRSMGVMTALGSAANAGDPLGEALEESYGVLGQVGGAAAEGPALLAEVTRAANVLFAAREAYRGVMLATWQAALQEVAREAVRRAGDGNPVTTPAQWTSLANSVADRVFVEAFHSQRYIDAQQKLSTALADQRRSEMKLVEFLARFGHFPTRRALDDVCQEVNDLRRRIRRLERNGRSTSARRRKAKAGDDR
jgi:hypothetical protein